MKLNKRIVTVMTAVLALFLVLVIYLTYFTLFMSEKYQKSEYDPRIWEKEKNVLRGSIYDRNGNLLAYSEETESGQKRVYPYDSMYAHTIGYNCIDYGKTNLELQFNDSLLQSKHTFKLKKDVEDGKTKLENGANISLTLDHSLTELAAQLMGSSEGSVVAINPKTGEVYCLYSNPTFNPNIDSLKKNWESLNLSKDSPFFSRATQGKYAPGSSFKIITATAGIESGFGNYTTQDGGSTTVGGRKFKNAGGSAKGFVDMRKAIQVSSNVYFTEISAKIGKNNMERVADNFYITKTIPFDIPTSSKKVDFENLDKAELAATAMGQGTLAVSPFNMAVATCGIANNGVIMKPYMVSNVYYDGDEEGVVEVISETVPEQLTVATDSGTANLVKEYMTYCVSSGTGTKAQVSGMRIAGKTGTAQNERKGKDHAWFVGIAPADNPQIVICVMKAYAGTGGGSVCAPIFSKLVKHALSTGLITY